MPAAAVLFLQAEHDGAIYGATGQHAHGFWLRSWRDFGVEAGDALGDRLHDERPMRQFTVSPLLGLTNVRHGQTLVEAGDVTRLRITALDDLTQSSLLGNWLVKLPARVTFAGIAWRVRRLGLAASDDPAAGYDTYAGLRDRHRDGGGGRRPARWAVSFESPLAFHLRDGNCLPFPLPGLLVAGWLNRWNEYSPVALLAADDTTPAFLRRVEAGLRISQYRLKTVSFRFRHEGPDGRRSREVPQIGCVGEATFDGAALEPADQAAVATLVDFAFFCGSGHHTTMGMGQTVGIRQ